MLKNEVLMKSSHKLKNQKSEHIQVIEQPLISLDLKFFIKQMKLRYDTEQDGVKIASHTNLVYFLHPKAMQKLSCKLPDVPKYYIK